MGCCSSSDATGANPNKEERQNAKQIDNQMNQDFQQQSLINKLLLLGAGESGKSTIFKQMNSIYGKGYSEQEILSYIPVIHSNMITGMKTLLKYSDQFGQIHEALLDARARIEELKNDETEISEQTAVDLADLWADEGIQRTYENRAKFQFTDAAAYFLDNIPRICDKNFYPTNDDIVRSRTRTTGIIENEFVIEGNKFKIFDVGGQRNERKKWIHCFEGVTAVLFVAALSEYDQMLFEDESVNRMFEALALFDEICNSRWFRSTAMVLFLNKRDLFQTKIQNVPLNVCFTEYDGPNDYENCLAYIEQQFRDRNHNSEKPIYVHATCATDRNNVQFVFAAVTDIIIRINIREAGLG